MVTDRATDWRLFHQTSFIEFGAEGEIRTHTTVVVKGFEDFVWKYPSYASQSNCGRNIWQTPKKPHRNFVVTRTINQGTVESIGDLP